MLQISTCEVARMWFTAVKNKRNSLEYNPIQPTVARQLNPNRIPCSRPTPTNWQKRKKTMSRPAKSATHPKPIYFTYLESQLVSYLLTTSSSSSSPSFLSRCGSRLVFDLGLVIFEILSQWKVPSRGVPKKTWIYPCRCLNWHHGVFNPLIWPWLQPGLLRDGDGPLGYRELGFYVSGVFSSGILMRINTFFDEPLKSCGCI